MLVPGVWQVDLVARDAQLVIDVLGGEWLSPPVPGHLTVKGRLHKTQHVQFLRLNKVFNLNHFCTGFLIPIYQPLPTVP